MLVLNINRSGCWALALCLWQSTLVCASVLATRQTTIPAPIAFHPDQNWDGIDGSWSSFTLRVGTTSQTVRVLPSWLSYQTLVIAPQGCIYATDLDACASARGNFFNYTLSSSFDNLKIYAISIESNLGYVANAVYGWDVVSLGGVGEGGPTLKNTTVGAVAVDDFYLGVFGLNPKPTNWTSFDDSSPSYMTQLKEQKLIPSVSFGYTAGAPYRFTGVVGSLTLGGYDSARFAPSSFEFGFAVDNSRDTVVAIQSITTSSQRGSSNSSSLLPTPIYALVDSTVPQIWLPIEACRRFEEEFGLVYDNTTDLYLVNSSLHTALLERDANITFSLAQGTVGGPTVSITLPYSAFDLTAQAPYRGLVNSTMYFPLRRAANDTQYTLGRTFMQEAYISVDYERAKFNVSQCTWVQDTDTNLVPIFPASASENSQYSGAGSNGTSTSSKSSSLSGGAIGGIVAGVLLSLAATAGLLFWYFRGKHRRGSVAATKGSPSLSPRDSTLGSSQVVLNEKGTSVFPKAELEGSNTMPPDTSKLFPPGTPTTPMESSTLGGHSSHISGSSQTTQVVSPFSPSTLTEAGGSQVFEMAGDMPVISQADGRQITEKDVMRRREEEYNGVDTHATPEARSVPAAGQQEPRQIIQPGEIVPYRGISEDQQPVVESHNRFSFEDESEAGTINRTA